MIKQLNSSSKLGHYNKRKRKKGRSALRRRLRKRKTKRRRKAKRSRNQVVKVRMRTVRATGRVVAKKRNRSRNRRKRRTIKKKISQRISHNRKQRTWLKWIRRSQSSKYLYQRTLLFQEGKVLKSSELLQQAICTNLETWKINCKISPSRNSLQMDSRFRQRRSLKIKRNRNLNLQHNKWPTI